MMNRNDYFRLNTDITADGERHYSLKVDAPKVVKGDRQLEYQPKITVSSPWLRSTEFRGNIVHSKGRREYLSLNLESRNSATPFNIAGILFNVYKIYYFSFI